MKAAAMSAPVRLRNHPLRILASVAPTTWDAPGGAEDRSPGIPVSAYGWGTRRCWTSCSVYGGNPISEGRCGAPGAEITGGLPANPATTNPTLPYATNFRVDSVLQSAFISFRKLVPHFWRYLCPVFAVCIPVIECPMQAVCDLLLIGFQVRRGLFFRVVAHLAFEGSHITVRDLNELSPLERIGEFLIRSVPRVVNCMSSGWKLFAGLLADCSEILRHQRIRADENLFRCCAHFCCISLLISLPS